MTDLVGKISCSKIHFFLIKLTAKFRQQPSGKAEAHHNKALSLHL